MSPWTCVPQNALKNGNNWRSERVKIPSAVNKKWCSSLVSARGFCTVIVALCTHKTETDFELLRSDVCGPIESRPKRSALYFVTFIVDSFKSTTVYQISENSDLFNILKFCFTLAEHHNRNQLRSLWSDGGGENVDFTFQYFLTARSIESHFTCPYISQENSTAERMYRTLMDMGRLKLKHNGIFKTYWAGADVSHLNENSRHKESIYWKKNALWSFSRCKMNSRSPAHCGMLISRQKKTVTSLVTEEAQRYCYSGPKTGKRTSFGTWCCRRRLICDK